MPGGARDLVERVAHRAEHPHTQDVELQVPQQLDVVLVGLDHAVAVGAAFQRDAFDQVVARQHDAARVHRDVAREPGDPLGHREQQFHLLEPQVDPLEFGQAVDRLAQVARRDVRERLRDHAQLDLGQTERLAHLADRRARAVGVDHRDASRPLGAVTGQDHVVDVFAPGGLDVDVDVGQVLAHRVHEPFERQVVTQRVDVGDAGEVAHERAGGAAPARGPDAHGLHVGDDVGHGQEVGREPHAPDHRELVMQPVSERFVLVHAAFVDAAPGAFGQQGIGAAAFGRGEVGEVDPVQPQVERAHLGDLERHVGQVGPFVEQRAHRRRRLQPALGVAAGDVGVGHRHDATHALERVGHERIAGLQVANRVGRHRPHAHPVGQAQQRAGLIPRSALHPVFHAHEQPLGTERLAERIEQARGGIDPSRDRGAPGVRPWPGDRDEPGRVRADLRGIDPGVAALTQHVRVGEQVTQVGVARVVESEQDDMGVSFASPPTRLRRPNRDRGAQDGFHAFVGTRADEPGSTVEPVAVGHGHRRHVQFGGARGQLLRRERALLQREARPHVQVHERAGDARRRSGH